MPHQPLPTVRLDHAVQSDIGMRRASNQDSVAAILDTENSHGRGNLFIVADGMGAHAAGELASKMAVDHVSLEYSKLGDHPPAVALREAVQRANSQIHSKGQSDPEFHGMGTTCTSMVVLGAQALVAHVGDTRVYRLRGELLEQLTFDHSLVWELAAASHTSAEEVPGCIPKNVITRSLGPHPVVNVDLEGPFDLEPGDTYLMCSDGLTGVVSDALLGVLLASLPPNQAAPTLIEIANLLGGPDNISVILVRAENACQSPVPAAPTASRSVRWGALAVAGACLAAVFGFVANDHVYGAIAAAIGMGAALVRALSRVAAETPHDSPATLGGSFGNGPYRNATCAPGPETTGRMDEIISELKELQQNAQAPLSTADIDWPAFEAQCNAADACQHWRERVAMQATAIRDIMAQVRREKRNDSQHDALG